jgi:hypothetical protein
VKIAAVLQAVAVTLEQAPSAGVELAAAA